MPRKKARAETHWLVGTHVRIPLDSLPASLGGLPVVGDTVLGYCEVRGVGGGPRQLVCKFECACQAAELTLPAPSPASGFAFLTQAMDNGHPGCIITRILRVKHINGAALKLFLPIHQLRGWAVDSDDDSEEDVYAALRGCTWKAGSRNEEAAKAQGQQHEEGQQISEAAALLQLASVIESDEMMVDAAEAVGPCGSSPRGEATCREQQHSVPARAAPHDPVNPASKAEQLQPGALLAWGAVGRLHAGSQTSAPKCHDMPPT
jgi:hypothetical protein